MQTLTKKAEERLISALNEIADLTNDGTDPNEAITKVASDKQIPAGHIQLLVNAYNTGRSTAQRRSSDDVWSKAAEFPLADTSVILENMYPDKVKTAADLANETIVSYEYNVSPGWVDRMKAASSRARKIDWKMVDPPEPYPVERDEYSKAKSQIKVARETADTARYKVAAAFTFAVQAKNDLLDHFKLAGCIPFQEVRKNAELLYGDVGKKLFDQLAREYPRLEKQASRKGLHPARGSVYDALAGCMELTDAYLALKDDWQAKQADAELQEKQLMRPFMRGPKLDPVLKVPVPTPVESHAKEAASGDQPLGGLAKIVQGWRNMRPRGTQSAPDGTGSKIPRPLGPLSSPMNVLGRTFAPLTQLRDTAGEVKKDVFKKRLKDDYLSQPGPDLEHEQQVNALNQEATLSDLLANDEILAHRDPHETLEAYSNLRQLAPRVAGNKELLRSYLRSRLEGGLGNIFELKQLSEMEKNLRDLEPQPPRAPKND